MSQKLSTITPTYFSFAPDQLLTHSDLNQVIHYFEDQGRLSRICLSGVGIVCGFKVSKNENKTINITQGSGITTDGDLVHFLFPNADGSPGFARWDHHGNDGTIRQKHHDSLTLTKYINFTDDDANYEHFANVTGMIELLPDSNPLAGTDLTGLDDNFFENKTIFLYVDCYSKDPGACTQISCDSQGVEEVQTVRVLVINDDQLANITNLDPIFNCHDVTEEFLELNDVAVPRVILDLFNTESINGLTSAYETAITDTNIGNLNTSLTTMMSRFGVDNTVISNLTTSITNHFTGTLSTQLFQYKYDLLKDLVDSYDEMKQLFISRYPECCPDIHSFPKHLMLGKVDPIDDGDNPDRHSFYPSPILTGGDSAHEEFMLIVDRLIAMTNNYDGDIWDTNREIIITPSNLYVELGDRSIPFYYDPQYDVSIDSTIVKVWDYNRRILRQYSKIKGYRQSATSTSPIVANPLNYSIDDNNFLRIEGIQGRNYVEALEAVNLLKEQHGLAFDTQIVAITVDGSMTIDLEDYACEFQDLSSQLQICIDEMNCILGTATYLFSAYNIDPTQTEGLNFREKEVMGRERFIPGLPEAPAQATENTSRASTATNTSEESTSRSYEQYGQSSRTSTQTSSAEEAPEATETAARIDLQFQEILEQAFLTGIDLTVLDNPVVQKMYSDDDGLGSIALNSFRVFSGTNSNDTVSYIDDIIDGLVGAGGDLNAWNPAVQNAVLYGPGRVLAANYAVSLLMPPSLEDVTAENIANFQVELTRLCQYAKQMQSFYEADALKTAAKTSDDMYSLVSKYTCQIESLCCLGEKLQSILDLIDERKEKIITNLQLSNYIQQHTGLEHKAGVEPGGTFIMVYLADESGGLIPNGTVVADFALPYLCCSDCAPINFIVPKPRVSLSLPTSSACIDPTSDAHLTFEFTVSPLDGVIEQLEPVTGVTISGTTLTIIQDQFDLTKLGEPIRFTVDGQYTETFIVVNEIAVVSMLISPDPTTLTDTENTFTFTPVGAGSDDMITWNFGDGSVISTDTIATHTYTLPVGANNEATVTLTVTPANGGCPATAQETIQFGDITVSIDQTTFCANALPYPFTIEPAGSNPDIQGIGVTSDGLFFSPVLAAASGEAGPYSITNDGVEFAVITVNPAPSVEIFLGLSINDELLISSSTSDVSTYTWEFYNADTGVAILSSYIVTDADPDPIPFAEIGSGGTRLRIVLIGQPVTDECTEARTETQFTVPRGEAEDQR